MPQHAGRRGLGVMLPALAALVQAALLTACASSQVRYYTELTRTGALGGGSPVFNLGAPIGSVSKVWSLSDGNSGVAFDVNRPDAVAIRRDSIMVLRDDPGGASLDVMTADPSSPAAAPGSQIDGAASQSDANTLIAARNLAASMPALAMMASAPRSGAPLAPSSPSLLAMQQQIAALQAQLLIAGATGAGVAAQQLHQLNQSAGALERQLIAAGHSPEAEQLRREVEALERTLTMPAPGAPSAGPGSPAPSGSGTLEIPPKH